MGSPQTVRDLELRIGHQETLNVQLSDAIGDTTDILTSHLQHTANRHAAIAKKLTYLEARMKALEDHHD